jgi:hypothetical protein
MEAVDPGSILGVAIETGAFLATADAHLESKL